LTDAAQGHGGAAYRSDIDGLRALAVLPVLLFHAGVPGLSGGFVGVDVFFVISGFLITGILHRDMEAGRYSILTFYERRARRLFPALFVVIAATAAVGAVLMMPHDLAALGRSIMATIVFASNVLFWRETGYFQVESELTPLLHTWSLAVEEQFYLAFPPLLWALRRWGVIKPALVALFLASLALSIWGVFAAPSATFYLPPTRAWELLLGALLALSAVRLPVVWAWVGIAMITAAVVFIGPTAPFPGAVALLPCIGAALVLASPGRSVLTTAPVVFIGKISYSLYLWHFPILAFWRYAEGELTPLSAALALLASFVLAVISWRWVEQPVRERRILSGRRALFAASAVAAVIGLAAGALMLGGLPARFSPVVRQIDAAADDTVPKICIEAGPCSIGAPAAEPGVVVWGDSHVWALQETFDKALKAEGLAGRTIISSGCPPLLGAQRPGYDADCRAKADKALAAIDRFDPDVVIVAANWSGYASKLDDGAEGGVIERRLPATVEALRRQGRKVVLVDPIPGARRHVPRSLALKEAYGLGGDLAFTTGEYQRRAAPYFAVIDTIKPEGRVQIWRELCMAGTCAVMRNGQPLYADMNHVTRDGADFAIPEIRAALRQTLAAP
jgi:peptidoglycan/LPS O-acetylase OafA/YrhL